ncbi:MAG TPA: hypothetical protein VJ385_07830 [Fibrobacteria bacterium]|nr:hypothetical protein [Fibrobacteria bacterium]
MRSGIPIALLASAIAHAASAKDGGAPFKIHGQSWLDAGKVMASHDTLTNDGTGDFIDQEGVWLQTMGVQFTAVADLSGNMEGAFGFGAHKATHSLGRFQGNTKVKYLAVSLFQNFITQARLTYFQGEKAAPWLSGTIGSFNYTYNRDSKNLGSYLLRGPVYPGLLMGGFQDFSADSGKANVMGFQLHHGAGSFSQDLILKNEKDLPPTFDWSLACVAKYKMSDAVEIGGGVNFYRLIPYNPKLETPGKLSVDGGRSYEIADTVTHDTVFFSHQGIKVMGMFSVELNKFLGMGGLGPDDLKLYGEAAILGTRNYGTVYGKIGERMPVMLGFNLPAWGLVDFLSVEGEYYKSPYRNDLANIGTLNNVADWTLQNPARPTPSPAPVGGAYPDSTRDNLKWSVNVEKTVAGHVKFLGQVANDHYRPRPVATGLTSSTGGTAETFTTPQDWYFMFRVGYFF